MAFAAQRVAAWTGTAGARVAAWADSGAAVADFTASDAWSFAATEAAIDGALLDAQDAITLLPIASETAELANVIAQLTAGDAWSITLAAETATLADLSGLSAADTWRVLSLAIETATRDLARPRGPRHGAALARQGPAFA